MVHSFITFSRREDVSLLSEAHVSKWINNKLQPLNLRIYNEMFDCLPIAIAWKLSISFSLLYLFQMNIESRHSTSSSVSNFFLFSLAFFLSFYGSKKNISSNNNNNNNNVTISNENTMEFIKASKNFSNILRVCNIQKRNKKKMKNDHTNQTYHIFSYMYNS